MTLLAFYAMQKKLYLKTEKTFIVMFLGEFFILISDIVSLFAIENRNSMPAMCVNFCCKIYLISLISMIMYVMIYVSEDIFRNRKEYYRKTLPIILAFCIGMVVVSIIEIKIHAEGTSVYTYGPAVTAAYVTAFLGICTIIIRIIVCRKRMNLDRRKAVLIWMEIWIAAALIQLSIPSFLVVGFASSIGIMILYIKLEDPGMNIDRQSGLFNQNAMMEYIRQKYEEERAFALVYFEIGIEDEMQRGKFRWEEVSNIISAKKAVAFRKSEDEGVVIFADEETARQWEKKVFDRINNDDSDNSMCLRRALWASIYDSRQFSSADELFYFMKYISFSQQAAQNSMQNNRIVADTAVIDRMRSEKEMEKLISSALESNGVEVFYQPIYSTAEGKFTAAEALARLRDKEGKIISPGLFIPVAEKAGKIIELGKAVFEEVCRFISENDISKIGVKYIEVNLSVAQCVDENLADTYIAMMELYHIKPEYINLEITESASLQHRASFMKNIEKLKNYGVSLSLDDFGTGQSNLNYIIDMPVDIVKFDRYMMAAFFRDEKAHYIVEATISMIHEMELKIVSEGIETAEQYERMKEMGIAYIQGYYFSKPVPQNEFWEFVTERNS